MDKITSLASFLSLFYVKNWCTASVVADASILNLEPWNQFKSMKTTETKTLKLFPPLYLKFAYSTQGKLEPHLWYVSERHIVFFHYLAISFQWWRKQKCGENCKNARFDLYHTFKKFDECRLSHTFKASSGCFQLYWFASKSLVTKFWFCSCQSNDRKPTCHKWCSKESIGSCYKRSCFSCCSKTASQ